MMGSYLGDSAAAPAGVRGALSGHKARQTTDGTRPDHRGSVTNL